MHPEMDKAKLLDLAQAEYAFVKRTLAMMDEAKMLEPGAFAETWSVKDVMGHIADWHDRCAGWLEAAARGDTPNRPESGYTQAEVDQLNAKIYETHKDRPLDAVLDHFERSYARLVAAAEALSEDALFTVGMFGWASETPLWLYFRYNTYDHYREHLPDMRRWLAG